MEQEGRGDAVVAVRKTKDAGHGRRPARTVIGAERQPHDAPASDGVLAQNALCDALLHITGCRDRGARLTRSHHHAAFEAPDDDARVAGAG